MRELLQDSTETGIYDDGLTFSKLHPIHEDCLEVNLVKGIKV